MAKHKLIRILTPGGIATPGYLLKILKIASNCGNRHIHFGSRQDVLFPVKIEKTDHTERELLDAGFEFEWKNDGAKSVQNIVSSYVANGLLASTNWVTEGTYISIIDAFDFSPKIKVNIVDPKQNMVPLYNGFLNFIASESEQFWYLYIGTDKNKRTIGWHYLIHSDDIVNVVRYFNDKDKIVENLDLDTLAHEVKKALHVPPIESDKKPQSPKGFFPSYEGIEKMENNSKFRIGFYWRNNEYSISFIEKVCQLCLRTDIAKISITPWKTFLVKDIKEEDLIRWEQLIGLYGINMRHSSFELNWHLPLQNQSALNLKRFIVKEFDKVDVRTYGLTMSIGFNRFPNVLTSIHIIERTLFKRIAGLSFGKKYDIMIAEDFDPNSRTYKRHATGIGKADIPGELIYLTKLYYNGLNFEIKENKPALKKEKQKIEVHQCKSCFSIYSEHVGEAFAGIAKGTKFVDLPDTYTCYTCSKPKSNFAKVEIDPATIGLVVN